MLAARREIVDDPESDSESLGRVLLTLERFVASQLVPIGRTARYLDPITRYYPPIDTRCQKAAKYERLPLSPSTTAP